MSRVLVPDLQVHLQATIDLSAIHKYYCILDFDASLILYYEPSLFVPVWRYIVYDMKVLGLLCLRNIFLSYSNAIKTHDIEAIHEKLHLRNNETTLSTAGDAIRLR